MRMRGLVMIVRNGDCGKQGDRAETQHDAHHPLT